MIPLEKSSKRSCWALKTPALILTLIVLLVINVPSPEDVSDTETEALVMSLVRRFQRAKRVAAQPKSFEELYPEEAQLPACEPDIQEKEFPLILSPGLKSADVVAAHPEVLNGRWRPQSCHSEVRLAVLVPYRNRQDQINIFLMNMHRFFQMRQYCYGIFVIEQTAKGPFDKGLLFNAGFLWVNKKWPNYYNCFALHDIDTFPMNTTMSYECPSGIAIAHLASHINKFKFKMISGLTVGGISVLNKETYLRMNGFSNLYFDWGGEDDDFYYRLVAIRGKLVRNLKKKYLTYMLVHNQTRENENRFSILEHWRDRLHVDGVNNMPSYVIKGIQEENCTTTITVEIDAKLIIEEMAERMSKSVKSLSSKPQFTDAELEKARMEKKKEKMMKRLKREAAAAAAENTKSQS